MDCVFFFKESMTLSIIACPVRSYTTTTITNLPRSRKTMGRYSYWQYFYSKLRPTFMIIYIYYSII